jgi:hypothetical protein
VLSTPTKINKDCSKYKKENAQHSVSPHTPNPGREEQSKFSRTNTRIMLRLAKTDLNASLTYIKVEA